MSYKRVFNIVVWGFLIIFTIFMTLILVSQFHVGDIATTYVGKNINMHIANDVLATFSVNRSDRSWLYGKLYIKPVKGVNVTVLNYDQKEHQVTVTISYPNGEHVTETLYTKLYEAGNGMFLTLNIEGEVTINNSP